MNYYTNLAKKAVETFVKKGKFEKASEDLPESILKQKKGVFVTIEKNGELRACIGTYLPTQENVAEEIIQNAVSAATEDYRFGPVQEKELSELRYTVYLLEQPKLIKSIKELNPNKYGIIVKTTEYPLKSALLLPGLDGINTTEKQISITCQKGGIDPSVEKIAIYKFSVKKYD
jgi:AmmeMemoRadiSam system protein A